MDKKMLIIIGVIVVIVAVIAGVLLTSPSKDTGDSILDIMGEGVISENGTIDVKLTNAEGTALRDKTLHVTVTDKDGKVVFKEDATTYANGVANIKLTGVAPGKYNVNVTFDGDENFTASSVSEELTINGTTDDNQDNNDTSQTTDDASDATASQSTSSSRSYSSSSYSSSSYSSSSSSDDGDTDIVDENGNAVDVVIDENGNEVADE